MSDRFFELCYDQYKLEMEQADAIYQRAGVMLVALPILGAASLSLGRIDLVARAFERVDVFIFHVVTLATLAGLATSIAFLFICIYPRRYESLASTDAWHQWREDYQNHMNEHSGDAEKVAGEALDQATFEQICPRLVAAQPINARINETRRIAFRRSVMSGAVAVGFLGAQAITHIVLKLQGI